MRRIFLASIRMAKLRVRTNAEIVRHQIMNYTYHVAIKIDYCIVHDVRIEIKLKAINVFYFL